VAGLLPKQNRGGDDVPLPRLFVVDYVEEREVAGLAERLARLARSATAMTPVRVLLLSRPAREQMAGWALEPLRELASGAALAALETAKDRSSAAAGLAVAERRPLFDDALREFGRTWHGPGWAAPGAAELDLSAGQYARPLDVLFEAYDAALSGPGWQPGGRPRWTERSIMRSGTGAPGCPKSIRECWPGAWRSPRWPAPGTTPKLTHSLRSFPN
jgi:hypothetical protein